MRIDVLTIFPGIFAPMDVSVAARARASGLFSLFIHDIRDYADDAHRTVDDRPYGGGPGMVMKAGPLVRAGEEIRNLSNPGAKTLVMSPRGERFTQKKAEILSGEPGLIIICGRYEGIDERVISLLSAEEISIGDYILCGGEVPAMAVVEAVVRLIPGVLGSQDSAIEESFEGGLLEYPQFTRPEEFRGMGVPRVLLSGNHEEIKKWRAEKSLERTRRKRPDLFRGSRAER